MKPLSIIILAQRLMVSNGDERFPQYITTAMCKCVIITNLDDSKLNAFQTFWRRLYILHLTDVLLDCHFHSVDSLASPRSFQNFHSFINKQRECHVTPTKVLSNKAIISKHISAPKLPLLTPPPPPVIGPSSFKPSNTFSCKSPTCKFGLLWWFKA